MSWKDKFKAAEQERENIKEEKEEYEGTLYAQYKGMKWWKTIGEGFKILAKTYLPTLLIFVSVSILFAIISTLAMTQFDWLLTYEQNTTIDPMFLHYQGLLGDDWQNLNLWEEADRLIYTAFNKRATWNKAIHLFIMFMPLTIGGVITQYYILEKAKGNDIQLFDSIKHTFRGERIGITILSTVIMVILIALGFSFFVIFGIVILIMVGLCFPTLVDSNFGLKDVLNEGFKLGKDFRLRTTILIIVSVAFFSFFGNFLAELIFPNVPFSTRFAWLDPSTRNWWILIYLNIANFITTAAFQPLLYTFLAAHYLELTVQKKAEWFDYGPLTDKKPLKIDTKDILMNAVPFGILTIIALVLSIIGVIARFRPA